MRYAYIYSQKICTGKYHVLSMQLTIAKYIKDLIDPIEITTITTDLAEKYDVICIDGFAINENYAEINQIYQYLQIIKCCKNVCVLTRDMHEWTFSKDRKLQFECLRGGNSAKRYCPKYNIGNGYKKFKSMLDKFNINNIISIYDCPEFTTLINYIQCKPYLLPLHIDTQIFKNLNTEKDIDILIYGDDIYSVYPLRNTIKKVVKTMDIKYHIIDPTSKYDSKLFDQGLAKLLNRSWLTVCTCSVFDYLVLKYFEAAACGSVVVGNMASQGKDIWQDNYIDIPNNASSGEISAIILAALSDKTKLKKIADTMQDKISSEYNYNQYAAKLKNICDDIAK